MEITTEQQDQFFELYRGKNDREVESMIDSMKDSDPDKHAFYAICINNLIDYGTFGQL